MIYLLAAGAGIAGAVMGWFIVGVAAGWIAGLFGMSDFEGARGMFAFFAVGPIGGLVVMAAAIGFVLRRGRGQASIAGVAAVMAGIVTLAGAGIGLRLLMIDTYSNELPPRLEFEIRLPGTMPLDDRDAVQVELHTARNVGDGILWSPWPRPDGDHRLLVGSVELAFKTSGRILAVELPHQPTRLFRLPLSRDPDSTPTFGDWRRADHVHPAGVEQPVAAPPDDPVTLRYRVRRAGEG